MIKCWNYRRIISSCADESGALPASVREHIRNCPACRTHYEAEAAIARQLADSARSQQQSPSPFLHARIRSSLAASQHESQRHPWSWGPGLSIGLAAACVVLAGGLWLRHALLPQKSPAPVGSGFVATGSSPAEQFLTGLQLREWTARLDEPLETELTLVVNDAKTAMASLAANFLPDTLRSSLFAPTPN